MTMDTPVLQHHPTTTTFGNDTVGGDPTALNTSEPSSSSTMNGQKSTFFTKRKNNKKKKKVASDSSSSCSNNCSSSSRNGIRVFRNQKRIRVGSITTRKSVAPGEVDALALPLGMSIAAIVLQVLERKNLTGENMSMDYLSEICILAVRESLLNVFGNKFDSFVKNFETSFRSTLMTLRLISESSRNVEEPFQRAKLRERSCEEFGNSSCLSNSNDSSVPSPSRNKHIERLYPHETTEQNPNIDWINRQLVVHEGKVSQQLSRAYDNSNSSMLSTIERSVIEQTRSNDLKSFEIGLIMKKLELKEKQISLNSDLNILERWKLSMGFSRASFKAEKFKTQLQDTRQVELLKTCLDFLVSGLIIMLLSIAYGTYVYSHRRIVEVTEACSPATGSKWWIPKQVSAFNSGLQIIWCQIQVLSRMLFAGIVIGAIAFLLIQRSSASQQTMPITFILLLLGFACGIAGKFCVDTLGGSGNHWLIYWETLCLLHFFSNIFHSTLYVILNGPICVVEKVERNKINLYRIRRSLFYSTLIILPLLCGFMPFASVSEWFNHFSSMAGDFMTDVED